MNTIADVKRDIKGLVPYYTTDEVSQATRERIERILQNHAHDGDRSFVQEMPQLTVEEYSRDLILGAIVDRWIPGSDTATFAWKDDPKFPYVDLDEINCCSMVEDAETYLFLDLATGSVYFVAVQPDPTGENVRMAGPIVTLERWAQLP